MWWWIVGIVGIVAYNIGFIRGVFYGSNGVERFTNYCDNVLGNIGIKKQDQ
jgi:hypothetical protein